MPPLGATPGDDGVTFCVFSRDAKAVTLALFADAEDASPARSILHIIFNAFWEPLEFALPPLPEGRRWCRLIDTSLSAPDDFADPAVASAPTQPALSPDEIRTMVEDVYAGLSGPIRNYIAVLVERLGRDRLRRRTTS